MFGYIRPYEPELKVKELGFYKSLYCGLCKTMGKRVCPESRLTLSYDAVFLALIRLLLEKEQVSVTECRCATSPFKRRSAVIGGATMEYCSAAASILTYHKIADDVSDKRGIKRLTARSLLVSARRMRRRAGLPELDRSVGEHLGRLSELEGSGCRSVDECASVFGELLAEIFSYGYERDSENWLISREIGFHTGKWIYILDAADDYESDKKNGEFNPLDELNTERLECALNLELEAVSRALALISEADSGIMNIAENIIYLGMPDRARSVLKGEISSKKTKKGKSE